MHQSEVRGTAVVPIPGTKRAARLEENAAAADIQLSAADLAAPETIAAQVSGAARPELPPELERMRTGAE